MCDQKHGENINQAWESVICMWILWTFQMHRIPNTNVWFKIKITVLINHLTESFIRSPVVFFGQHWLNKPKQNSKLAKSKDICIIQEVKWLRQKELALSSSLSLTCITFDNMQILFLHYGAIRSMHTCTYNDNKRIKVW
jgi:hypothetical protein